MTEKAVEKTICRACGADVRPGALFCYACGAAVAPAIALEANDNGASRAPARNQPDKPEPLAPKLNSKTRKVKKKIAADVAIRKPEGILPDEVQSKPKAELKPAAPRRESRAAQKKTVKVVWEEAEGDANVWFIIVALVLVAFAVLALVAMLSLE